MLNTKQQTQKNLIVLTNSNLKNKISELELEYNRSLTVLEKSNGEKSQRPYLRAKSK